MAALVEWPFNLVQLQDAVKAATGLDFPGGGPDGFVASFDGEGAPEEVGALWSVSDPSGTFSDQDILDAAASSVFDTDYGEDADALDLARQAFGRMVAIARHDGGFSQAQAAGALKSMAAVLARLIRIEYAPDEAPVG